MSADTREVDGQPTFGLLLFLDEGWLSLLEIWWIDEPPAEFPAAATFESPGSSATRSGDYGTLAGQGLSYPQLLMTHWLGFCNAAEPQTSTSVLIPPVGSKGALLAALAAGLHFPSYFGNNWDALDECLGDLGWFPPGPLSIVHESIGTLDDRDLATYLAIARDAAAQHARDGRTPTTFVFSEGDRPVIERAARASRSPSGDIGAL